MGNLFIAAGLALPLFAFPAQSWAQTLTLNCQYESSYDLGTHSETPISGAFSAIVSLNEEPRVARIETTAVACFAYIGGFDEQEVSGQCERVAGGVQIKATLTINRINGNFEETKLNGKSGSINSGRCAVAKKLF